MRLFSRWIIALFASPLGVFVLGALDSTVFFNLPLGIDAAVVLLGARAVYSITFFRTLTACRVVRFGIEASLALIYGQRIISWLDSDLFHDIVGVFIVLAVVLTTISIVRVIRTSGRQVGRRAPV